MEGSENLRDGRPTFFFKNNQHLEIRAAGVLPYVRTEEGVEFLMIRCNRKYEDFGGKTDIVDKSIEETAARETEEESNCILKKDMLLEKIKNNSIPAYSKHSKYILYFVEVDEYYHPRKFGTREKHENIKRTVEWVPIEKFKDIKFIEKYVHFRLKFSYFFNCLDKL